MLYDEFLVGTGATDNSYNYAEYKRIEQIYLADDSMSKADAYKLYNAPNKFILSLLAENEKLKGEIKELHRDMDGMESALKDTSRKLDVEKSWNREYLSQLRKELDIALYTIEDKLGVF
jgi:predicted RNase H-like nuclease (RuvC/YqgF family)